MTKTIIQKIFSIKAIIQKISFKKAIIQKIFSTVQKFFLTKAIMRKILSTKAVIQKIFSKKSIIQKMLSTKAMMQKIFSKKTIVQKVFSTKAVMQKIFSTKAIVQTIVATTIVIGFALYFSLNSILGMFGLTIASSETLSELETTKSEYEKTLGELETTKNEYEKLKINNKKYLDKIDELKYALNIKTEKVYNLANYIKAANPSIKQFIKKIASRASISAGSALTIGTSAVVVTTGYFEVEDYCNEQKQFNELTNIIDDKNTEFNYLVCFNNAKQQWKGWWKSR